MFLQILTIISPIILIAGLGFIWAKAGLLFDNAFLSRLVMHLGLPCLVFSAIVKSPMAFSELVYVSQVSLACLLLFIVVYSAFLKITGQSFSTYIGPLVFTNTGNMGIPICLFAFGPSAMVYALVFSMLATLLQFSIGVAFLGGKKPVLTMLKAPVFYATGLAFIWVYFAWPVPSAIMLSLDMLGSVAIPLMIFSLGLSLASLHIKAFKVTVLMALARLLGGLLLGFLIVAWFDLTGLLRGVVLLQAVMPCAVSCYMLASLYDKNSQEVAAIVAISTLLSFVSLPLFLWYLL